MTGRFANIIVDISHEKVDRPFQYLIPPQLQNVLEVGMSVMIPFGIVILANAADILSFTLTLVLTAIIHPSPIYCSEFFPLPAFLFLSLCQSQP